MEQGYEALNLEQALRILRRRVPLILVCGVVVAAAAFAVSKHQHKKYTATASLAFSNNTLSQQIAGLQAATGNLLAQQASNLELVKLGDMAAKTASSLGHGLTAGKVEESLSIAGQGESSIVAVSATLSNPVLAAAIVNTYTRQFVLEQERSNRRYFASALALVNKQLQALSPAQRTGEDGLALQQRAQTLHLLVNLDYGNVKVAQEAIPPSTPSSPKPSRNTVLGALLGLLIGLGLAFVLERFDRGIKGPEELEKIYEAPMLGVVPESAALSRPARHDPSSGAVLPPDEAEAFSLIRAHLRFFNVDHDLRTVVIASASPGDGKTTVAHHLAEAAARLGSRVLLLEADLRQPALAEQLGIQSGPGLTDVLTGVVRFDEATQSVDVGTLPGERPGGRALDVLVAGSVIPPNPGELIESYAIGAVLERAKSAYDLVLIDTPPLAAVSDAFPLLTKVDGVVLVGWVGRSRRDVAERLHRVLASSEAPVLGVIANGAKSAGPGYGPYPGKNKSVPAPSLRGHSSPTEFSPGVEA